MLLSKLALLNNLGECTVARLSSIVINSTTPHELAQWWAPHVGGTIAGASSSFVFVDGPTVNFLFQQVPDPTPGTRRIHFDFEADPAVGRVKEVARFVESGATEAVTHTSDGFSWTVLEDPEGNQFCVSDPH